MFKRIRGVHVRPSIWTVFCFVLLVGHIAAAHCQGMPRVERLHALESHIKALQLGLGRAKALLRELLLRPRLRQSVQTRDLHPWVVLNQCDVSALEHGAMQHLHNLSVLTPVPCRDDFAAMAQSHFNVTGRAAEVGVFQGEFARRNLQKWKGQYYAIDAWTWRPNDPADKNYPDEADNNAHFRAAQKNLRFAGGRVKFVRSLSVNAARRFPDCHFDWIFIDALHTYDAVITDLRIWWRKLRRGGLMSGDDYGDATETEYVPMRRYIQDMTNLGPHAEVHLKNNWGVITAVQDFAGEVGAVLHVTWMRDCYAWPAWYMVRP